MEGYRSKSCRDGGMMEIACYNGGERGIGNQGGPTNMHDLRSYSTSHASSVHPTAANMGKIVKIIKKDHKMKNTNNNSGSTSKSWSFNDPELQRKKRVAAYKVYTVEGKMKGSFKKSFRWIKDTCSQVVHGWR